MEKIAQEDQIVALLRLLRDNLTNRSGARLGDYEAAAYAIMGLNPLLRTTVQVHRIVTGIESYNPYEGFEGTDNAVAAIMAFFGEPAPASPAVAVIPPLKVLYPIYAAISPLKGKTPCKGPPEAALATALGIDPKPYSASMGAAYELLDLVSADEEYLNVDFREYRKHGYIICDINDDADGTDFTGSHRAATRAEALFGAIVFAMVSRLECEADRA